jgi:hypothetical protein
MSYEDYLQSWEAPIHPSSEEDLSPMSLEDYDELTDEEVNALEDVLGDLEPATNTDYINIIASLKNL